MPRHFLIAVFVLFIISLGAQKTFHRGYPINQTASGTDPDTSAYNVAAIQLKDKSYVSLDGIIPTDDSTFHYFLLTNYDEKGDINWSREIKLKNSNLRIEPEFCSLLQGSNDSIYFSFSLFENDNYKTIGAVDKAGADLWLKVFKLADDEVLGSGSNQLVEGKDSLLYNLTNNDVADESNLILSRLTKGGNLQLSLDINNFNEDGLDLNIIPFDVLATNDTALVVAGVSTSETTNPTAYLSELNNKFKGKISVSYFSDETDRIPILSATHVGKKGSNYYLSGQYWSIDPFDFLNSYLGSFVLKADAGGEIVWSKIIDPGFGILNNINGLHLGNDGNVYVSGNVINGQAINPFIVSLKEDGSQNWFNIYNRAESNFTALGALFGTQDNGLALFHSDVEEEQSGELKTGFIKTDLQGKTTCESKSNLTLLVDHPFLKDTLNTDIDTVDGEFISLEGTSNSVNKFDIPILTLEDKNDFCPNEPINFLFDATVQGAVAYKWNDNSTKDTLRVFDTGEYSVTVTIDDKYCFMLCDTGKLERLELPVATLIRGQKVCRNTDFEIFSTVQNGKTPYNFQWSTGAIDNNKSSIKSKTLGNYSLTVTDACNEKSIANVTVDESVWFGPPFAAIAKGPQVCEGDPILLAASGSAESGTITSYAWSNSTTGETTSVPGLGTFTVTVTDNCGLTDTEVITLDGSAYYKIKPAVALSNEIDDYCQTGNITIIAAASSSNDFFGISEIKWSNGQTSNNTNLSQISVANEGEYKVTVTDVCGNTNEGSIKVENPSSIIDSCVQFPTLFLPGSRGMTGSPDSASLAINNFFGAFSACSMNSDSLSIENLNLQNFEMRVFNRWGKEIFASTDPLKRWEGKLEDGEQEFYPSDVYLWVSKYKIGEFCSSSRKGNVTLIK